MVTEEAPFLHVGIMDILYFERKCLIFGICVQVESSFQISDFIRMITF